MDWRNSFEKKNPSKKSSWQCGKELKKEMQDIKGSAFVNFFDTSYMETQRAPKKHEEANWNNKGPQQVNKIINEHEKKSNLKQIKKESIACISKQCVSK